MSGYVSCVKCVMIAAARVHSWKAWRMAGSVPACITHIMLPSSHQHCTSHSGLGRSYLYPLSWGTNTNAGILSCSGLISIHVAVTDAGRAVFLCLLWCLLTGSREIVFRLIWKPGPISQGAVAFLIQSYPCNFDFVFILPFCMRQKEKDRWPRQSTKIVYTIDKKEGRGTASEPEPDHMITIAWLHGGWCFRGWILVLDHCSPHLGVIHNTASVIWPGI